MENTETIPALLDYFVSKYKNKLLFQRRDGWSWKQLTWLDCDAEIKNLASFLLSLDFKSGDGAVIISSNKIECVFSELAIYYLGGTVIPFSNGISFSKYSGAALSVNPGLLFLENSRLLNELEKDGLEPRKFRKVIVFDDTEIGKSDIVIPYKGLVKFGQIKKKELFDVLKSSSGSVKSEQSALILFSENGNSKMHETVINHRKILELVRAVRRKLDFITEEDQSYSYLLESSLFEKLINLTGLALGMRLIIAEDMDCFYKDILEAKPTVLFESSSEIERIYDGFVSNTKSKDMRSFLGGRLKYLVTDSVPKKRIEDSFRKSGIDIIELPEISGFS